MSITVGERIVLHLNQFSKYQDDFDVPIDVSQDGIASALRISRAHAAIELKKLKEAGEVTERLAHIKRGKTKRKVYFLSPKGSDRALKVKEFAEKEGIEIIPFLDLKRCKGPELWSSINEKHRPIFGQACVFRRPFKRGALPETSISLLPEDQNGMVDIPAELRSSIPPLISAPVLKQFHSFAADYWLREGDYRERLYHLIKANRTKEAEMLIASRGKSLLSKTDNDLFSLLSGVEASERYRGRVRAVQAEAARRMQNWAKALLLTEEMKASTDPKERNQGLIVEAKVLSDQGKHQDAYQLLLEAREMSSENDPALDCEIADTLIKSGRYTEAKILLEPLLSGKGGDGENLERIFFQLGTVALRTGQGEEAIKLLSKSRGASKNKDSTVLLKALSEAYALNGMSDKSAEYSSKLRKAAASP